MPELPEAETIRRELEKAVVGRKIVNVEISVPRVLRMPAEEFKRSVDGATIIGVESIPFLVETSMAHLYYRLH